MSALDSLWKRNFAALGPYWHHVFGVLGARAVVLPLVGPGSDGAPDGASFTARRWSANAPQAVFTWSEPPASFDAPFDPADPACWQGIASVLTLNGSDEKCGTPSAYYWSLPRQQASFGAWVRLSTAANATLFAKKLDASKREYRVGFNASGAPVISVYDSSRGGYIRTEGVAPIGEDEWHFVVWTYNGLRQAHGLSVYCDGALCASTDSATDFTGSSSGSSPVRVFEDAQGANLFYAGKVTGGPLGPFHVDRLALKQEQVERLYTLGRAALGLV